MIPTNLQLNKGRRYNRKIGEGNLEMYKMHGMYFVKYRTSLRGFWTYGEAREYTAIILLERGI